MVLRCNVDIAHALYLITYTEIFHIVNSAKYTVRRFFLFSLRFYVDYFCFISRSISSRERERERSLKRYVYVSLCVCVCVCVRVYLYVYVCALDAIRFLEVGFNRMADSSNSVPLN